MKKKQIQLLLLALLLLILVVVNILVKGYNAKKEQEKREEEAVDEVSIAAVAPESIQQFSYEYEGETYSFSRNGDIWQCHQDPGRELIQDKLTAITEALGNMKATQIIEDVTDFNQYGLGEEGRAFSFDTGDAHYSFVFGDYNMLTAKYYMKEEKGTDVYVVDNSVISKLNVTLDDLTVVEEAAEEATEEAVGETAGESEAAQEAAREDDATKEVAGEN